MCFHVFRPLPTVHVSELMEEATSRRRSHPPNYSRRYCILLAGVTSVCLPRITERKLPFSLYLSFSVLRLVYRSPGCWHRRESQLSSPERRHGGDSEVLVAILKENRKPCNLIRLRVVYPRLMWEAGRRGIP